MAATKRLTKKYFSCASKFLKSGMVPMFYLRKVGEEIGDIHNHRYLTIFRPWLYQDEIFGKVDMAVEVKKHFDEVDKEIETLHGIDMAAFYAYCKTLPKKPERNRKEKEEKELPVRKLKDPQSFHLTMRDKTKQEVIGEKVFSHQGYDFFIHHNERYWIVSDVLIGMRISHSIRYKEAVKTAKETIHKSFDNFVKQIETFQNA